MNVCIITIGDEILNGNRLDTNSQWIAKKIVHYGMMTEKIISISDNQIDICKIVNECVDKYEFVFITGGLGPTHDDITLSSFSKAFSLKSKTDQNYIKKLKKKFMDRNIKMPNINKNQGLILENTNILDNPIGTARGLHYRKLKTDFFIMPGVPDEMYIMMEEIIIPSYFGDRIDPLYRIVRTSGISESKLVEKIDDLMLYYASDFNFSFLPSYKGVDFVLKTNNIDIKINDIANEFYDKMSPYSFGYDKDSFVEFMIKNLSKKNLTIALAESCTGGHLGKILTDISGSSEVFLGGVIAYCNSVKIKHLKVPKEKIEKYGAVSPEVSDEMAKNVRTIFNSNIGVSITGISGPSGGAEGKEIGLVYIGISFKNKCISRSFNFNLNRELNRKFSCYAALNMIRKLINE